MDSVVAFTLKFWPHTIRFLSVWPFERQPARTPLCRWQGSTECRA